MDQVPSCKTTHGAHNALVPEQDSFADKLREIRKKHGLTQDDLAHVFPIGFSVKTLRNWEQGRVKPYPWMQPVILWWMESKLGKR
jgi:DNA-binding transcriptional regulator YiaG